MNSIIKYLTYRSFAKLTQKQAVLKCHTTLKIWSFKCFHVSSSLTKDIDEEKEEDEVIDLRKRLYMHGDSGHQILVLQPYIKWGRGKKQNTKPELMLEESKGLVESLSKWKVVDGIVVPLETFKRRLLFGTGNLEELKKTIRRNLSVTAVFVSIEQLTGVQRKELEQAFKVPVFDRFSLVLHIFKERAQTKEAKLQVALAEVPYLRSLLRDIQDGVVGGDRLGGSTSAIGGAGETFFETRKRLLSARERRIKDQLETLRAQRQRVRINREKRQIPVISVVGYTNAGKTSLIRSLTGDDKITPENRLFATLDVTAHAGYLPCNLQTIYVDTVGFLTDLPMRLIEAFSATLEDALNADAIIHVRDISHPEAELQFQTVNSTLSSLNIPQKLKDNVILVANKVDKLVGVDPSNLSKEELEEKIEKLNIRPEDGIPVCAT
ncbi:hypothetical protein QYM36_017386, partial [Artemia franciscana]